MNEHKQRLIKDTLTQVQSRQMKILFIGGFFTVAMLVCDFFKTPDDPNPYKKRALQAAGVTLLALVYAEVQKDKLRQYLPQGEPPHRPHPQ
jgi:hypothetical protein